MSDFPRQAAITAYEKNLAWVKQVMPNAYDSVQREFALALAGQAAQREIAASIDRLASAYSSRGW